MISAVAVRELCGVGRIPAHRSSATRWFHSTGIRVYARGKAGEAELNKWLLGTWKISSLRFLTRATAPKVITALKAMKTRAA